ncbi:MAG TPA: 30S ribosomal protein S1 [Chloroflexia bacterium]|nr:30S ribosomal protein S1 [Chloroflexia bacterium]
MNEEQPSQPLDTADEQNGNAADAANANGATDTDTDTGTGNEPEAQAPTQYADLVDNGISGQASGNGSDSDADTGAGADASADAESADAPGVNAASADDADAGAGGVDAESPDAADASGTEAGDAVGAYEADTDSAESAAQPSPARRPVQPQAEESAQDEMVVHSARDPRLNDVAANASMEDLLKASEQQYRTLKYGDVIEGSIMKVDRDEIMVDIGGKTEGIIPSREAQSLSDPVREALQIGAEVLVSVVQPESSDGNAILSLDRARQERAWRDLHKRFEAGEIIQAQVVGHNKGGLLVNLEGIRGFVPSSQISSMPPGEANKQAELARLHNQTLPLKIIEINRNRNRLILSERQAMQEQREGMRARLMRELEPGQIRPGTVTSIADFGAFVDIGGADGLIHLSELSWKRVSNPREVLKEGDRINVHVLSVDPNERKIALSLKRTQPEPWETITDTYQLGQVVRGTITQITTFGAFARLDDGIEGLIHVSELAEGRVAHPKNVVKEGDALDLKVIRIDPARKRIGLSLKRMNEGTQAPEGAEGAESTTDAGMPDVVTPAAVEEAATTGPVLSAESPAGPTPQGYAAPAKPQERREQPAAPRPSEGQAGGGRRNVPALDDDQPVGALAAALAAHAIRQADDEDAEDAAANDYATTTAAASEAARAGEVAQDESGASAGAGTGTIEEAESSVEVAQDESATGPGVDMAEEAAPPDEVAQDESGASAGAGADGETAPEDTGEAGGPEALMPSAADTDAVTDAAGTDTDTTTDVDAGMDATASADTAPDAEAVPDTGTDMSDAGASAGEAPDEGESDSTVPSADDAGGESDTATAADDANDSGASDTGAGSDDSESETAAPSAADTDTGTGASDSGESLNDVAGTADTSGAAEATVGEDSDAADSGAMSGAEGMPSTGDSGGTGEADTAST